MSHIIPIRMRIWLPVSASLLRVGVGPINTNDVDGPCPGLNFPHCERKAPSSAPHTVPGLLPWPGIDHRFAEQMNGFLPIPPPPSKNFL